MAFRSCLRQPVQAAQPRRMDVQDCQSRLAGRDRSGSSPSHGFAHLSEMRSAALFARPLSNDDVWPIERRRWTHKHRNRGNGRERGTYARSLRRGFKTLGTYCGPPMQRRAMSADARNIGAIQRKIAATPAATPSALLCKARVADHYVRIGWRGYVRQGAERVERGESAQA
jgi:hypothetical protein